MASGPHGPPRSTRFSRPSVTHGPDDPPGGPEAERRPPVRRPRDRRKRGTPDPQRRRPHAARRPRPHGRLGEAGPATGDGAALRRPRHRQQAPRFDGSRGPSTPRGAIPCDPQDLCRPARWGRSRPSGLEVGGDVLYRQDAAVHRAPAGHRPGDRRRVEGPEAARAIGTDQAKAVTEKRSAEERLSQSENRLRLILQQAPVLLWSTDGDLHVTSAMGGGFRTLDTSRTQERGLTLFDYFSVRDEDLEPIASHRRALGGERVATQIEWQGRTYDVHIEPLRSSEGAIIGTLGVAFDVSERTRTEETLRRSA